MRQTVGSVGKSCVFDRGVRFYGKQHIHFGDRVNVNNGVTLQSCDGASIMIGNDVVLSYDCMILTGALDRQIGSASDGHVGKPVAICDRAWLGARCIVLPGVTVGENSVIAAGAIVTRDIPPNSVAAGVPAQIVRTDEPIAS